MTISYNDVVIIDNLFPRLFKRNSTLEYYGEVADEWYINKDLKKLEIKIKQKMFSDGSNISVDDIVLSIKDAINPSTLNSFFFKNIKDVRTISSNRLEIDYIGWEGLLFQQLSSPFLSIYKNGVAPTKQSPDSWLVKMPLKIETWTNDSLKILNSDKNITLFLTAPNSENIRNLDVVLSRESPVIAGTNLFEDEYFKNNFNSYSFDTYNTKIILLNEKIPHNTRVCISHLISNSDNINKIYKNHRSSSLIPQGVLGYAPQKQNDRLVNKNLKLISDSYL
jgi:ABC-type transport system substrate-binding protein